MGAGCHRRKRTVIDARRDLHLVVNHANDMFLCPEDQASFDEWQQEQVDISRCGAEQAEIEKRGPDAPDGWLAAIGWADWEAEKWFILAKHPVNQMR